MIHEWDDLEFFESAKYLEIKAKIQGKKILPAPENIFKAFELTPLHKVKAVIIGQDPYHTPGLANGLAFSVPRGYKIPPSLQNIFRELVSDIKCKPPEHGDLACWANEGVLLLNSALTVEPHKPGSHSKIGWEDLLNETVHEVSLFNPFVVFILWGNHARQLVRSINPLSRCVISSHPSPLGVGYGFFGSKPFSRTNKYLEEGGVFPINWEIP